MISVLILTKNEELDLPKCLYSVKWSNDIHVLDSYSNDNTVSIAKNMGAKVHQRIFDGYASQRNFALSNFDFANDWILILDSDERIPTNMIDELISCVKNADDSCAAFRLRRKDFFFDTWLKYSQISPFYVRLIRKGKAKYYREINEVIEIDGQVSETSVYFNHYPFSKGLAHWINKHNIYSTMEAQRYIYENKNKTGFSLRKACFSRDFNERRYHQKGIFYKLPGRPILKMLYMFFWRLSFLDGYAGITYTVLQCIYEYFIVLKAKEMISKES